MIMRNSKLKSYTTVLEVLVNKPMTIDEMAYEIDVDCLTLKHRLNFLINNHVVEERKTGKKVQYAITEKGIAVIRTLNFTEYLGKIANDIGLIDEATEIIRQLDKDLLEKEGKK